MYLHIVIDLLQATAKRLVDRHRPPLLVGRSVGLLALQRAAYTYYVCLYKGLSQAHVSQASGSQ
ncbi:hypothetical protein CAI21_10910 [Alkalilimnicola ehrlichii]|uniref:Uncharacterized protein n=1 Tax=Alkalilimnicola ehrlichii TaxID=351052 RepID=A0A3E0WVG2_9GAMM|nr:hypothetical protein CAI21_10910 [Alkalilimnicola ehrlichii]RFA36173.1 hypothetical protein CAL65_12065 [Alkalilimnicola ehrlichii]